MINFEAIATRAISRLPIDKRQKCLDAPFEKRSCPDQFVGVISEIERQEEFTDRYPASKRPPNLPCVLLVLESPHKAEFDADPEPAKGGTGRNIVRYFRHIPGLDDKGDFGLLLVNAVQFQCSLGKSTSLCRDAVFSDVWESGGEAFFASRIRELYRDGDVVVNCCTRGKTSNPTKQLRTLVQRALVAQLQDRTTVLRLNHPSFWHFPANRSREWSYAG
jgi:hypothetical protein